MTDVEGSSQQWNRAPTDMGTAMQRHNQILQEAVLEAGGELLDGEGDSKAAAFVDASAALQAAGTIQRRLTEATLPIPIKVRIGLHEGEAFELAPSTYGGAALCFLGRLHKAAHGGQILVSETAATALGSDPGEGWTLVDLGDHVFRDFYRRRVYQATLDGLPSTFPPLAAPRTSSIPEGPGTTFVGTPRGLEEARQGRLRHRVTTLVGPSGVGKTRLALEMSRVLEPRYRDGVAYVELAGTESAHVALAVASALFVDPHLESSPEASLTRSLRGREVLVLLDNCEHVIDGVADLLRALAPVERAQFLLTSRLPVAVDDEHVQPVLPLGLPSPDDPLSAVAASEAVQLLVDRASSAGSAFAVSATNRRAVVELCQRFAGIPLDIELAAGALRSMPAEELAADLVSGRSASVLTARAASPTGLGWSLDHIGSSQAAALEQLSVFPAGSTVSDLIEIAPSGAGDAAEIRSSLGWAVDRALVQLDGQGRYRLLEPLRQEMLGRLTRDRRSELELAHAGYMALRSIHLGDAVQGPDEADAVAELEQLWPSIRSAVLHDTVAEPARAASVCMALHEFCMLRMRFESYEWIDALLRTPSGFDPSVESALLAVQGLGAFHRGDLEQARLDCERSVALSRAQDLDAPVHAHFGLMVVHGFRGNFDQAQSHFSHAARWCNQPGRGYFLVNTLVLASMAMTIQGDAKVGVALARSAVDRAEEIGNPTCLAWGLAALAEAERLSSPGAAHVHLDEALEVARAVRSRWVEGQVLLNLAALRYSTSALDSAMVLIEALSVIEQTGSPIHGRQALRLAMILLAELGRYRVAGLLQWAARQDHSALPPAPDIVSALDASQALIARHLGADVAEALLARGRRLSDADLVTTARSALIELLG
ncbi:MAG: hypothetical protein R2761_02700 [Acidimicrobiales bacterium]